MAPDEVVVVDEVDKVVDVVVLFVLHSANFDLSYINFRCFFKNLSSITIILPVSTQTRLHSAVPSS